LLSAAVLFSTFAGKDRGATAPMATLAARGANKLLGYAGLLALAGKPLSSGHRPAQDVNLTRR
jgi:hypothetical protein